MNGQFFKGQKYHGKDRALYFKQWSCEFVACIKCGTDKKIGKHKHKGRGICRSCWDKERAKNPQRKLQCKKAQAKWYNKVVGTPEWLEYAQKNAKRWRTINKWGYRAVYKKRNLKGKFTRFILGQTRNYKKNKNGLKFICDGCSKNCQYQSCIKPPKMTDSERYAGIRELEIFKKVLIKECKDKL